MCQFVLRVVAYFYYYICKKVILHTNKQPNQIHYNVFILLLPTLLANFAKQKNFEKNVYLKKSFNCNKTYGEINKYYHQKK